MPLIIAFVILAAFTYSSGLRAPAAIAIVKDLLIYITAFAAIIIIPIQLGGFGKIFAAVPAQKLLLAVPQGSTTGAYGAYATLALGSALALFLYPHSLTGILSASSGHAVRRNAALLPAYSFMLGLLALLGFMAIAVGVDKLPEYAEGFKAFKANFAVPALLAAHLPVVVRGRRLRGDRHRRPGAGRDHVDRGRQSVHPQHLSRVLPRRMQPTGRNRRWPNGCRWWSSSARWSLSCSCRPNTPSSCNCSAASGSSRRCRRSSSGSTRAGSIAWALLIGWAVGTVLGTAMAASVNFAAMYPLAIGGWTFPSYIALSTLVLNLIVAAVLTPVFNVIADKAADETLASDYAM